MIYTVIWRPAALEQLAEFWVSAADRQAITNAADDVDRKLRRDPVDQGESRDQNRRVFYVSPLAVMFEIDDDDRKVHVLDVWLF